LKFRRRPFEIAASIANNPYFGAGAGLLGVGTAAALTRRAYQLATREARRRYLVSIELQHTDKSYQWFLHWMSKNVKSTQHLSVMVQSS